MMKFVVQKIAPFAILAPLLSGCATEGLQDADTELANATASGTQVTLGCLEPNISVANARQCLVVEEGSFHATALGLIDESSGWNYGFVAGAAGGAGAAAFDSSLAALKAIGLAIGTASAFNSVRSPSALATLYINGETAMSCIYRASSNVPESTSHTISGPLDTLSGDLLRAQAYANGASPSSDKNLALLNQMISSAEAAQQVGQNAQEIENAPGDYIMEQARAVEIKMEAKLNATPVNVANVETTINTAVNNTVSLSTAKAGANAALPGASTTPPKGHGAAVEPSAPSDALSWSTKLQIDIVSVLRVSQGLADAQTKIPVCVASIPS